MKINYQTLRNAKTQRKTRNPWEAKLWYHLRAGRMLGFKFKRQMPIGKYIVDFCCHEKRLIIELDGGQHTKPGQIKQDKEKKSYLRKENFKILRFQNIEVDKNSEGVLETIRQSLI